MQKKILLYCSITSHMYHSPSSRHIIHACIVVYNIQYRCSLPDYSATRLTDTHTNTNRTQHTQSLIQSHRHTVINTVTQTVIYKGTYTDTHTHTWTHTPIDQQAVQCSAVQTYFTFGFRHHQHPA
jgi:hypothetical protein